MQLLKIFCIPALATLLLIACKKNDDNVTPSPKGDMYFELPQGNAPYDHQIVDWYRKYGSYVLYRFPGKEFRYGITGFYYEAVLMRTADTIALPAAVEFLKHSWFDFYTDDFLRKYLPFKILLAGQMLVSETGLDTTNYPVTYPMAGFDYIIFPAVDTAFRDMTKEQRRKLKTAVHALFLEILLYNGNPPKITPPAAFFEVSSYDQKQTVSNRYEHGFLVLGYDNNRPIPPSKYRDLMSYIYKIISTPARELQATILAPATDKNGLVGKKYNLLLQFFKTQYQVDLQAIGE
ncbi:MAG TPA: hypothetical protein VM802_04995 [Chitinophaga sp.]|uniref:hypothetical protein n=1 Tax=Chitinophaga sp. TaxID=1869181 RepID=UPI002BC772C2|nr:hypothetical protein [Chitinophaga sp.]HVI44198.1 hypothetical protein [Chitinophaga sp.]